MLDARCSLDQSTWKTGFVSLHVGTASWQYLNLLPLESQHSRGAALLQPFSKSSPSSPSTAQPLALPASPTPRGSPWAQQDPGPVCSQTPQGGSGGTWQPLQEGVAGGHCKHPGKEHIPPHLPTASKAWVCHGPQPPRLFVLLIYNLIKPDRAGFHILCLFPCCKSREERPRLQRHRRSSHANIQGQLLTPRQALPEGCQ